MGFYSAFKGLKVTCRYILSKLEQGRAPLSVAISKLEQGRAPLSVAISKLEQGRAPLSVAYQRTGLFMSVILRILISNLTVEGNFKKFENIFSENKQQMEGR